MKTKNTIFILMDELFNYKYLPNEILAQLKGYNAFKKIGVEFTNIHCNRTVCSPSRSSIISGTINHGIQDNVDNNFQYDYIPKLNPSLNTIAKLCKKNNFDITAYYGKQHFDATLASSVFIAPMINTNTRKYMKQYGFDIYSTYGDAFYTPNQGIFADASNFEMMTSQTNLEFDWIDPKTGYKYVGMLPFLKARKNDCKKFYCEYHITNPHDTQHFIQNFSQLPTATQLQFWAPYIGEQFAEYKAEGTLAIEEFIPIENVNLKTNFFEKTYSEYKNNTSNLPFKNSYELDYVSNSKANSIFPFFVSNQEVFEGNFTFPLDESDIKSWKNLINNYYGLIIEADNYIYKIYKFLEDNDMLSSTSVIITADHGDQMSAHGLKQKNFHFRESLNVPLVIYSPDIYHNLTGKQYNNLGNSIDIYPTIQTLLNLENFDSNIVGSSLLERSRDKLFVKNVDNDVFHVTNGFMFVLSGFTYPNWFSSQPAEIQDKVIYQPTNIFDYLSQFVVTITKFNNREFKFARYYNINEIITYNFKNNPKWNIHGKEIIFEANMIEIYLDQQLVNENKQLINKLIQSLAINFPNGFNFENGYKYVQQLKSDVELFIFYDFIFKYIDANFSFEIIIPGLLDDFLTIANNPNYAFFCYDINNDPEEIYNLADPNYPERFDIELFTYLNDVLNKNIVKYNCRDFIYIFQYKTLDTLIRILVILGKNISEISSDQLILLYTVAFYNNLDSTYSPNFIIDKLLKIRNF